MTSLTDVYAGGVGTAIDLRRRLLGAALFVLGAGMVVGAIPVATTDLAAELGLGLYGARELAGILAGVGLPAAFVGIFAVLPAGRATRAAAAIGASLAVLGVAMFVVTYPYDWLASAPQLAVATTVVYSLGTLVTFWCLFVGLATFKRRNDPGGTARVEITDQGTVRVISDEDSSLPGFGSVGLFGSGPDGSVETQTNREMSAEHGDATDTATAAEGGNTPVIEEDATILDDDGPETSTPAPGGATPASDGAGGATSDPTEMSKTICNYCSVGCGFRGEREGDAFVGMESWDEHPVNAGNLCSKGAAILETEHSEKRLKRPMIMEDGEWRTLSWARAYERLGDDIK
ncbi:hypothetical protein BRD09_01705, partial [Halobacteriales archaeon SW_10_68_16]